MSTPTPLPAIRQTARQTRLTHVCHLCEGRPWAMESRTERALFALFLLNVALQIFDGVATYVGLGVGFDEGNPLLAHVMTATGPVSALLLTKLYACGCLAAVWHLRRARLALPALV